MICSVSPSLRWSLMERKLTQRTTVTRKVSRWDIVNIFRYEESDRCHQMNLQQRPTAPDIDVNRLVSKGNLAKANSFIQQLQRWAYLLRYFELVSFFYLVCRAIFARQNDPRNMGKSLTDCLSGSVQVTFNFCLLSSRNKPALQFIWCIRRAGPIQHTNMWRWVGWTWVRCHQDWLEAPSPMATSVSSESR